MAWREFNHSLRLPNHPNDPASEHVMTSAKASFDLVGLFDFLEDVLAWVKDRDGRYLWVNRAFLINYALEHPNLDEEICERQILGKTDYDLSPAFLADEFRLDDEYALAGNRVVNRIERVGELGASRWCWRLSSRRLRTGRSV